MFSGSRRIKNLPAYPLEFHPDPEIWSRLVSAGRKFVSLIGCYHQQYEGNMFIQHKDQLMKVHSNGMDPGEFAVEKVAAIQFADAPFDMLVILEDKKKVIKSLTESRVRATTEGKFDDIIEGKGQGVIILLQYVSKTSHNDQKLTFTGSGPPGVGKTLTAEAISERLQRPLYSISAGDLSAQAEQLEVQLTRTFRVTKHNRLVATFLRTLEYYPGIFFLTTNMLQDFDAAILDHIQLKLQYHDLDLSARQAIFQHFCDKTGADVLEDEICNFAQVSLNGQQIKNVIKLAQNVAMSEGVPLRADHIRSALRANGYTLPSPGSNIDNSL
ncbi:hypothetical protein KXX27_007295 [Aspergillus fumigatus]|nr:hypothetical protein KXX27_007295 [Aspergillus fumigatus]